ncbi:aspartate aminotransferase family protein [Laceyella putida]|uniref:Diaminobutyrate--2-oxoglutarate transaminase n=1 Tax=Laceyella putida TaxID=110101 RepID=A0ABW2RFC4_9BACL
MSHAPVIQNAHYLANQEHRESNARSYPRRIPIAIKEASGITVKDVEGKVYIDCLSGAGTLALGHNHPVVIEAIQQVLNSHLPLHTLDITTPVKDEFVEELFSSLPEEFASRAKIQFCGPAGADAVEAALKLVKTATGRRSILSFHGAYHGMTHGALSLTGNVGPKQSVASLMPDVHFLPYPYSYRCPFNQGGELGEQIGHQYVQHVLDDPESGIVSPAGLIMEIVQGEGGVIPAPDNWVRQIRSITRERGIPLIVDEVQTGLGRTGKLFAFEHADIIPDVVILSKAIGGSLPLAVVVYDKSLDQWAPGAHAGTFRGNQMAMAAGIATIRFIRENKLETNAAQMGNRLISHLKEIQKNSSSIGEVRGRGLMVGVEIVNTQLKSNAIGSYPAYPELARQIQQECFTRGLILELGGRYGSVVRFLPPLLITEEQVDHICGIFDEAVRAAEKKWLHT